MHSHALTLTLALTIFGTSQLISAVPVPKKLLSTRWYGSGGANTGLAPGGSVNDNCNGDIDCSVSLINLFSGELMAYSSHLVETIDLFLGNAGDGGAAGSSGAQPQDGASGRSGADGGGGEGRRHPKNFRGAKIKAETNASGGSVNGAGSLINLFSGTFLSRLPFP